MRIDEEKLEENGRLAGIAIASHTLRAMLRWRERLSDYDSVMIMISVVAISAERLLRSDVPDDWRRLDTPIDPRTLGRVNISSIAHATGLNRETARRKVNELVEMDLLTRFEDGSVAYRPGLMQEERTRAQIKGQLNEIVAVVNQLNRMGILTRS